MFYLIGLAYSSNRDAVMYPWYTAYNPDMKLLDDDVLGIQTLYGKFKILDKDNEQFVPKTV